MSAEQKSLLEETLDTDLAAVAAEIEALQPATSPTQGREARQPKREPLPPHLPRREVHHEPENTTCALRQPDAAHRRGRGREAGLPARRVHASSATSAASGPARCCEKLVQAPVPAHVIDKGIPTAGLLAQVLVAKFLDHLPLYRQEAHLRARRARRSRARRWRSGWASAARSCSRWWMR